MDSGSCVSNIGSGIVPPIVSPIDMGEYSRMSAKSLSDLYLLKVSEVATYGSMGRGFGSFSTGKIRTEMSRIQRALEAIGHWSKLNGMPLSASISRGIEPGYKVYPPVTVTENPLPKVDVEVKPDVIVTSAQEKFEELRTKGTSQEEAKTLEEFLLPIQNEIEYWTCKSAMLMEKIEQMDRPAIRNCWMKNYEKMRERVELLFLRRDQKEEEWNQSQEDKQKRRENLKLSYAGIPLKVDKSSLSLSTARDWEVTRYHFNGEKRKNVAIVRKRSKMKKRVSAPPSITMGRMLMAPMLRFTSQYSTRNYLYQTSHSEANAYFQPTFFYDVDPVLGSTAMPGLTEMAGFDQLGRTMRSTVTVEFSNTEAVPCTVFVVPSNINPGLNTGSNFNKMVQQKYCKRRTLGPLTGSGTGTIKYSFTTKQITGQKWTGAADTFTALLAGSAAPSNNWYWFVGADLNGVDFANNGIFYSATVVVEMFMFDQLPLAG